MEHIQELVNALKKYAEQAYAQHDNYIAEDLQEAARLLEINKWNLKEGEAV